jgi:hypothetical protein
MDALALAQRHGCGKDRDTMIDFYTRLLLGFEPTAGWSERLTAALASGESAPGHRDGGEEATIRKAVALILAMPEAQLG